VSRSVERRILERIKARHDANRQDYVDFNQLPREVVAVAIDGLATYGRKGTVIHEAGRPIAYFSPVHWNLLLERWESYDLPPRMPAYVPAAAIIGSLPAPEKSLRERSRGMP
jgi:hypothetical protein